METLLVKIFATALALSQVTTAPDLVATRFDRATDQAVVAQLLRAGCAHMRRAFDIEDINLDELIATAMEDPEAIADQSKAFRGINFADLQIAYRQFCKNETVKTSAVDLAEVGVMTLELSVEAQDVVDLHLLVQPALLREVSDAVVCRSV